MKGNCKLFDYSGCINYFEKKKENRAKKDGTVPAILNLDCNALKSPEMLITPGTINIEFSSDYWSLG